MTVNSDHISQALSPPAMSADLARAILLADECSPMPASAVEALRALRRALATERGVSVTDLVRVALAHRTAGR